MNWKYRRLRTPDDATGGGETSGNGNAAGGNTATPPTNDAGDTKTPNTPAPDALGGDAEIEALAKRLSAAGYNVLTHQQLDERLNRKEQSIKEAADVEARKKYLDELKAKGDLQEVANQLQNDLTASAAELTTLTADADQTKAALSEAHKFINKLIQADVKDWEEAAKASPTVALYMESDPGKDNLAARMEWWEKAKKHPEAFGTQPSRGNGRGPLPVGNPKEPVTSPVPRSRF